MTGRVNEKMSKHTHKTVEPVRARCVEMGGWMAGWMDEGMNE